MLWLANVNAFSKKNKEANCLGVSVMSYAKQNTFDFWGTGCSWMQLEVYVQCNFSHFNL